MFLLDWYQQYLDIKLNQVRSTKEDTVCSSCETLKQQLEIVNYEKSQLLNRIMKEPEPIKEVEPPEMGRPKSIPWNLRRQMLEREDRERARLIRDAPKPDSELTNKSDTKHDAKHETEQFEKELEEATKLRESQVK